MKEIGFFEIDATTIFVLVISVFVLISQLLLCYKARKLFLKLIPIILLVISTIVFSVLSACIGGWDGMGLLFFALFSFGLLFVSGFGWAIWVIVRKRNR